MAKTVREHQKPYLDYPVRGVILLVLGNSSYNTQRCDACAGIEMRGCLAQTEAAWRLYDTIHHM